MGVVESGNERWSEKSYVCFSKMRLVLSANEALWVIAVLVVDAIALTPASKKSGLMSFHDLTRLV